MKENTINWDYLAGWFDADGWVSIARTNSKQTLVSGEVRIYPNHHVLLGFGNTDKQVIEAIQAFLGVARLKIRWEKRSTNYSINKKDFYTLQVVKHNEVSHILKQLKNRCITKRGKIIAALKWLEENPLKYRGKAKKR